MFVYFIFFILLLSRLVFNLLSSLVENHAPSLHLFLRFSIVVFMINSTERAVECTVSMCLISWYPGDGIVRVAPIESLASHSPKCVRFVSFFVLRAYFMCLQRVEPPAKWLSVNARRDVRDHEHHSRYLHLLLANTTWFWIRIECVCVAILPLEFSPLELEICERLCNRRRTTNGLSIA